MKVMKAGEGVVGVVGVVGPGVGVWEMEMVEIVGLAVGSEIQ